MPDSTLNKEDEKLFYRVGEVSKILNVSASLLRFWEKDFECLQQIHKNRKGDRLYTLRNIEDLKIIYHLVKEKGYTLQGANDYMKKNSEEISRNIVIYSSLKKIKSFLEDLKDKL